MNVDLFNAISAGVVQRMTELGLPPLVDGAVLLGPENSPTVITSAVPRITLVPLGGTVTKRVPAAHNPVPLTDPEYQKLITQPWLYTDVQSWRADISGVQYVNSAADSDLKANWDWTAALLYVFVQTMTFLAEGSWKPGRYEWVDSKPTGTKLGGFGRLVSFWFEVNVPVLLFNLQAPAPLAGPALTILPQSATGTITANLTGGSTGDAIIIHVP